MKELLLQQGFDFIRTDDKDFIIAFDAEMNKLGYTCIGNGIAGAGI